VARLLAQKLATQMEAIVVVESKPGDNGNIAAEYVAKAKPDGYTLLVNTSAVVFSPAYGEKLSFDLLTDFAPVEMVSSSPFALAVNPAIPSGNLNEFISYLRANPGKFNYGSPGTGGISHLGGLLFLQANGLSAVHIPYKSGGQVMTDIAAGHIQFSIQGLTNVVPLMKANRVRALATTGLTRAALLPDVPTLNETVMPKFELVNFGGVLAPARTPPAIIRRLNVEIAKAFQDPDIKAKLFLEGGEPRTSSVEEYGVYLRNELNRWTKIVKDNNIKPD
jgi:tripartite-type tricarboxylate transporter receptor subunit TctC